MRLYLPADSVTVLFEHFVRVAEIRPVWRNIGDPLKSWAHSGQTGGVFVGLMREMPSETHAWLPRADADEMSLDPCGSGRIQFGQVAAEKLSEFG